MPVSEASGGSAAGRRPIGDLIIPGLTVPDPTIDNTRQYVLPDAQTDRTLIGGVGLPWLRDLDYGTQWINRNAHHDWPDRVIIEDMSYAAHRVLDRLKELRPSKVILVGCMPRHEDPPGTIRRYDLDLTPPSDEEVQERLGDSATGIIDLDHTLAIARYYRQFPDDTIVIEVEPEDDTFGLGFSDAVEATVDDVLELVRKEL